MKLLKSFSLTLVVGLIALGAAGLNGCATSDTKPISVDQVATVVCSNFNTASTLLNAFNAGLLANPVTKTLGAKLTNDLAKAQQPIATACAEASTITNTQLLAAVQQALPAFAAVIAEAPLPAQTQATAQGALVLAEGAVGLAGVIEQQIKAAQAAQVPASASTSAMQPETRFEDIAAIRAKENDIVAQIDASTDTQTGIRLARKYESLDEQIDRLIYAQ